MEEEYLKYQGDKVTDINLAYIGGGSRVGPGL